MKEKCESSCESPVVAYDDDGVPLCKDCNQMLINEYKIAKYDHLMKELRNSGICLDTWCKFNVGVDDLVKAIGHFLDPDYDPDWEEVTAMCEAKQAKEFRKNEEIKRYEAKIKELEK